jgi:transcriptional regulator with XRE-family HTH domain
VEKTRYDLANEIRAIRNALDLTMREFGRRVGVTEGTVSRWESAKVIPDAPQLEQLAKLRSELAAKDKMPPLTAGLLARFQDVRERERMAPATGQRFRIGAHTVTLLSDGSLDVNGIIVPAPD